MSNYITLNWLDLAKPRVIDRTSDLKVVVINYSGTGGIHLTDAELAREYAAAFTKAAELLEAIGPEKFCAACGALLPQHREECPRGAS